MPPRTYTRADLDKAGKTQHAIDSSLRSGALRHVLHDVYVDGSTPDSVDLRLAACARILRPGQIVVDRSAAWLHGVVAFTWGEHDVLPVVEVCAMSGREPVRRQGVAGGERDLRTVDVMDLHGVSVTTPLRTALDLGCRLRRREAYAAVNDLARVAGIHPSSFHLLLPRFAGRRGVVQLRELLPLVDRRLESPREAWVWLALHDAGLPRPTPQLWVGDSQFRLDFAYERLRIAIEYDGEDAHGPERAAYDLARREWLRAHGWRTVVVRAGDFTGDALERWLREVRTLMCEAYDNRRW